MTKTTIAVGAAAAALLFLVLAVGYLAFDRGADPAARKSPVIAPPTTRAVETHPSAETHQGFIYGRVTTITGATHEGRLRLGGDEEAFWGDTFNGFKDENPWVDYVPRERLLEERSPVEIFGLEISRGKREIDLGRPFMARFGDIARIEALGRDVRVTLKSGLAFDLDRFAASDFDDGLRVWDGERGVVDLDSLMIRTIELFPAPSLGAAPYRLHGTVRTRRGEFTGFLQWNREKGVGTDELDGRAAEVELGVRFDTIRSVERRSRDSVLVTLLDGREIVLSGRREVGRGNRGIYVDDRRYGRVLVSWDAFERADFGPGGSGPAYGDFHPGSPLTGSVTTSDGGRLAGRLVYDLDESETIETLDAPFEGVDYSIPFGLIASIVPRAGGERGAGHSTVTLHDGEELRLERAGDLGEGNAGMLVFAEGRPRPEFVPWTDVGRVDFERPQVMSPPLEGR